MANRTSTLSLEIDTQFRRSRPWKRLPRSESAEARRDARQQLSDGKRFYDVIVRTRIKGRRLVSFGVRTVTMMIAPWYDSELLRQASSPPHTGHVHVKRIR